MKRYSKSYKLFKKQDKDLFNLITTIFYGISSLKYNAKQLEKSGASLVTPRPEYFEHDKATPKQLLRLTRGYKLKMGAYGLLSLFSFFESYVNNILKEILDFQGGCDDFIETSQRKNKVAMNIESKEISKHKSKLQRYFSPHRRDTYVISGRKLTDLNYTFPSQLFSSYGILRFSQDIDNMRAKDIPNILLHALQMEISKERGDYFIRIKNIRNAIAHGEKTDHSIKELMEFHTFLSDLAKEIDNHVVDHFFIYEKYS